MSQTPNVRVPLVYIDRERAGQITREWLPYLTDAANAASAADLSALQTQLDSTIAALAAAQTTIAALSAAILALDARIDALEGQTTPMVFQPASPPGQVVMVWQQ